jgi:ubiquinone/menaquinone biosynthesis C-methylase UbiE
MFDKHFYDFIYGTIHHHDYADGRAEWLIQKYGKARFLEIGAGCGILVKALREKGADAWGIEISDYAVSENCCPGFLSKGDMREIPFPDQSFDVVHSQAVFGYLDEKGTEKAIEECKRVGKHQFHSIDLQVTAPYPYDYVFMRPRPWWDERISNDA